MPSSQVVQFMHIGLLSLRNAPLTSVLGPHEILTLAGQLHLHSRAENSAGKEALTLTLVGNQREPDPPITAFRLPLHPPSDEDHLDWVIVSAAGSPPKSGFHFDAELLEWIRRQHQRGACLASSCTGAFFLAEAGLLNDREATTHWMAANQFRQQYPQVRLQENRLLTRSDNILCAGGAFAYVDMSLAIIASIYGKRLANHCARLLNLDVNRTSQSLYSEYWPQLQHQDDKVRKVQDWLQDHYAQDIPIEAMASQVHLGERHFKRRFKAATGESPLHYLQNLRIERARQLLEETGIPVESIAQSVGYEDTGFFRTLFRRRTGKTPGQYRAHYRMAPHDSADD